MATNYPASIDASANLPLARDNATTLNATLINNLRNAIIAIETELGVKPSGVYATVRSRLDVIDAQFIRIAGDIAGTAANPIVVGLGGRPVSTAQPNVGDAVIWNGSQWAPHSVQIVGTTTNFSGDLSGNDIIQAVVGLHGRPLSGAAPLTGQSIVWNGSAWAPANTQDVTFAGDLSGSQSSQTVIQLQGRAVLSTAPTTNQVLEWNGSAWAPTSLVYAGDLSGTATSQTVTGLRGNPVSATLPSVGQVLAWGGSSWAPSSTADLVVDAVFNKVQGDSPYSIVASNLSTFLGVSGLSGTFTANLPSAPTTGQKVIVKDTDGSLATHSIVVAGTGGKLIDGASSYTLSNIQGPFSSLTVQFNGTSWSII